MDGKSAGNHGFYHEKYGGFLIFFPLNKSIDYPGEVIQSISRHCNPATAGVGSTVFFSWEARNGKEERNRGGQQTVGALRLRVFFLLSRHNLKCCTVRSGVEYFVESTGAPFYVNPSLETITYSAWRSHRKTLESPLAAISCEQLTASCRCFGFLGR